VRRVNTQHPQVPHEDNRAGSVLQWATSFSQNFQYFPGGLPRNGDILTSLLQSLNGATPGDHRCGLSGDYNTILRVSPSWPAGTKQVLCMSSDEGTLGESRLAILPGSESTEHTALRRSGRRRNWLLVLASFPNLSFGVHLLCQRLLLVHGLANVQRNTPRNHIQSVILGIRFFGDPTAVVQILLIRSYPYP